MHWLNQETVPNLNKLLNSADSAAISSHKRTVNNNEQALGEDHNGSTATVADDVVDASGSEVQSVPVKDLFLPVKGNKRVKKEPPAYSDLSSSNSILSDIKEMVKQNDYTQRMIDFFEKRTRQQRNMN